MKRFFDFFLEIGVGIIIIADGFYQWREAGKKYKREQEGKRLGKL